MKYCPKCDKEFDKVKGNYCFCCGERLINKKCNKKVSEEKYYTKSKTIIIILCLVIFFLLGLLISSIIYQCIKFENEKNYWLDRVDELNSNIRLKSNRIEELKSSKAQIEKKCDFYDNNVVFVINGYGNYYYTYDQMMQVTQGKSYKYWAYNIEQAISLGYRSWK